MTTDAGQLPEPSEYGQLSSRDLLRRSLERTLSLFAASPEPVLGPEEEGLSSITGGTIEVENADAKFCCWRRVTGDQPVPAMQSVESREDSRCLSRTRRPSTSSGCKIRPWSLPPRNKYAGFAGTSNRRIHSELDGCGGVWCSASITSR